ncbi:MAG: class I SAM-dependent methyltransferase [Solirubrobacterales bacterium]
MPGETDAPAGPPDAYSLANFGEIMFPCLEAISAESVIEVGAYRGDFTRELLAWAKDAGAEVTAIEPEPPPQLLELAERHPELKLVREESHEALASIPLADVVVIDGDHNYYTLSEELRLIEQTAGEGSLPLLLFHDVCWPHARRDTYYAPERIPGEHRQPLARDATIAPGEPGLAEAGLEYPWAAEREGGPANGVLTAIEDFISGRGHLRLAVVPTFFGLGILWSERAPWADRVAVIVEPWDSSPMLQRLEADRVAHIVDQVRLRRQEQLLRSLLDSRAFALAERISRLRQRGAPVFSREQVRRVLGL